MRRGLSKGLSHLIVEQFEAPTGTAPIENLVPNRYQPRQEFEDEALDDLARSIDEHGVISPILVRPISDNQYEIIAGERRWRAAKLAGLEAVPILVREASNSESLQIALIENIQREGLDALETAEGYRQLVQEFGLSQEQVAERVGKSRSAVANTLRVLALPEAALQALRERKITEGHARALLGLPDAASQLAALKLVIEKKLSVRQTELLAQERKDTLPVKTQSVTPAEWEPVATRISEQLGAPVRIAPGKKRGGEIVIPFASESDLERIMEALRIDLN